jgi:hypothetical protein
MPVATKTGLNASEIKIPANKHNIQTGNSAPAMLITGLHPKAKKAGKYRIKRLNGRFIAFHFRSPTGLFAKMHERIAKRRARNLV